jgi:trans-2,3-dihydro-3-hydroxyanthranilate isomerase
LPAGGRLEEDVAIPMGLRYLLVDVFTDRPLAGNALAVFPEAGGVPAATMQAIAREMNLSESSFVTQVGGTAYDVRLFTPGAELPFAGHPTLGTAWTLRRLKLLEADRAVQRSPAGDTPVSIALDTVWFERTGNVSNDIEDVSFIAHALGVSEAGIGFNAALIGMERTTLAPAIASAGVEQLVVPIADAETLAAIRPRDLGGLTSDGVYCFAPIAPTRIKARFFAPGVGVAEDPATGSAAAALGLYLSARGGDLAFDISQGVEVGRPSTITVVTARGRVRVGGSVVAVGEGELDL